MSITTGIDGIQAGGNLPTWVIPGDDLPEDLTSATTSLPLATLTAATTVKIDCHADFGDINLNVTQTTRERRRMCQTVAVTINTGQTINLTIRGVYDQQAADTEDINAAWSSLPVGSRVGVVRAYGWASDQEPTAETVVDLIVGEVQSVTKVEPANADEDLKFEATVSGELYLQDLTLTAA